MAITPPTPKTMIGEKFRKQMTRLAAYANEQATAAQNKGASTWYRPEDFTASLAEIKEFGKPFDRIEQVDQFVKVADRESPGTVGDLQMVQLQGDFMACAERAFRARHHSTCRSRIQPVGRYAGHGHDAGPIIRGLLGYIVNTDRVNKGLPS